MLLSWLLVADLTRLNRFLLEYHACACGSTRVVTSSVWTHFGFAGLKLPLSPTRKLFARHAMFHWSISCFCSYRIKILFGVEMCPILQVFTRSVIRIMLSPWYRGVYIGKLLLVLGNTIVRYCQNEKWSSDSTSSKAYSARYTCMQCFSLPGGQIILPVTWPYVSDTLHFLRLSHLN